MTDRHTGSGAFAARARGRAWFRPAGKAFAAAEGECIAGSGVCSDDRRARERSAIRYAQVTKQVDRTKA